MHAADLSAYFRVHIRIRAVDSVLDGVWTKMIILLAATCVIYAGELTAFRLALFFFFQREVSGPFPLTQSLSFKTVFRYSMLAISAGLSRAEVSRPG